LFNERVQFIAEKLIHLAQAAFLGKGRVFEIVRFDAEVGGDGVRGSS
jgi:hypothetical protein